MKKLITLLLVLTGMVSTASAKMYILGTNPELGSWVPSSPKEMTQASDGTYYFKFTATAYSGSDNAHYFCFSTAKGNNSGDWDTFNGSSYRPTNNDKAVDFGQPLTEGVGNNTGKSFYISLVSGTEYLIAFDPSAPRIVVTYAPSDVYVLGGADGWATNSGITMSASDDYVYTCNLPISSTITTFSFTTRLSDSSDDWSGIENYRFGAQSSSGNYEIGTFPNKNISLGWGSNNDHSFTIPYEGTYKLVMDYKLLKLSVYETEAVSVGAKGFATYCNAAHALDFTGNSIKAYTISSTDGSALTLTPKNKVAKSEPVLLYSETNSDSQSIPVIADGDATADASNKLVAGDGLAHTWSETTEHYILYTGGSTPGFYRANKSVVAVGKAYLNLTGLSTSARSFDLNMDNEVITGINAVENSNVCNAIYNLNGQRVAQPAKGLYIMNGKKVIIK